MIAAVLLLLAGEVTADVRLPAGTIVEPTHLSGAPEDTAALVGRQMRRTVFPGRPVGLEDTKVPDLVERNGLVRIVARKGPLRVETRGRSLGAGGEGEEILVMNLESRRTVAARIVGPGLVEVGL
jgi:flagella basal body P-ring formation protein FlgA